MWLINRLHRNKKDAVLKVESRFLRKCKAVLRIFLSLLTLLIKGLISVLILILQQLQKNGNNYFLRHHIRYKYKTLLPKKGRVFLKRCGVNSAGIKRGSCFIPLRI